MKKLQTIINIIMGSFTGVFVGHCLFVVLQYRANPQYYAMQAAPWYTSILVYGACTLVIYTVCIAVKWFLNHCGGKGSKATAQD